MCFATNRYIYIYTYKTSGYSRLDGSCEALQTQAKLEAVVPLNSTRTMAAVSAWDKIRDQRNFWCVRVSRQVKKRTSEEEDRGKTEGRLPAICAAFAAALPRKPHRKPQKVRKRGWRGEREERGREGGREEREE